MRVLMVTPGYYPIKGGTETMVQSLSTELKKIGVHIDVMTFNMDQKWNPKWKGKIEKINGITVFKIPALNWLPIEHSPRITLGVNLIPGRFTHLLEGYDIIHFHEADFSFPLFSFFVKKPKIFHLHGIDANYYKRYYLSRLILKHVADLYISISKEMKKHLVKLDIPKNKIVYLPNGVDTRIFRPEREKTDNLVLFVGRITFDKGLHVLLRSLRYIEKSVRLVIIGPADWNLEYYRDMLKLIEDKNRNGKHKITYLGPQDQANIIKWYQKASILVSPSLIEAFGLANLEALSCETPVVATYVGGIPEVVRNGENGILVPPSDVIKLAKAIQYFLDNEDIKKKFGKEGRRWVVKNFSIETIVEKLSQIYKELICNLI